MYNQRFAIPSYYYHNNNYYYRQPCYKCQHQRNDMFSTSQQQFQNHDNNNNNYNEYIPNYTSGYQRPQFTNGYNVGYSNNQPNLPYQSSFSTNENRNINTDVNINTPLVDSTLPPQLPPQSVDERTILFDKGQKEIPSADNNNLKNTQEVGLENINPSFESNINDQVNKSPAVISNENQQEIPISTPISGDVLEGSIPTRTSPVTIDFNNDATNLPSSKVEFNVDDNNNNNNNNNPNRNNKNNDDGNKSEDSDNDEENDDDEITESSLNDNNKRKKVFYESSKIFKPNMIVKGVGSFNHLKNIKSYNDNKMVLYNIERNTTKKAEKDNFKRTESLENINIKDKKILEHTLNLNKLVLKPIIKRLNYTKIINTLLKNLNSRNTALLLQALRQQITRKESKEASIEVIKVFAFKDILNLRNANNSIVYNILLHHTSQNDIIKEEFARFLNAIASFKVGRTFLINFSYGKNFIYPSVVALKNKRLDEITSSHILAAIQKVSIKQVVQKELLQQNILDWLVKIITEECVSPTFFDFGIGLILNLVLNPFVQSHIFRITHNLVVMLSIILQKNNFKNKNIIYGILYVVLELRKVRVKAKELKIDEILYKHLTTSTTFEEKYIIAFLLCCLYEEYDYGNKKVYTLSENDDNWDDYIEAEIESTDRLRPGALECFGEKLLVEKYQIKNDQKDIFCQTLTEINKKLFHNNNNTLKNTPRINENKNLSISLSDTLNIQNFSTTSKNTIKIMSASNKQQKKNYLRTSHSLSRLTAKVNNLTKPPNSTTSYKTFILENDKRKPLLLPCGLKSAIIENSKLIRDKLISLNIPLESDDTKNSIEKKTNISNKVEIKKFFVIPKKVNIEKSFNLEKKKNIKNFSNYKKNNEYNKNDSFKKNKFNNSLQIETLDIPTSASSLIDISCEDFDVDYDSVFLSRPKVLRTPDKVNLNKIENNYFSNNFY